MSDIGMAYRLWEALGEKGFSLPEIETLVAAANGRGHLAQRGRPPRGGLGRDQEMKKLFENGATLQEIGTQFNVTRERVRQILKKAGITGKDGGARVSSALRKVDNAEDQLFRRQARVIAVFDCDMDTFLSYNDGLPQSTPGCLAMGYRSQKRNAERRGIEWKFNFPQWVDAWRMSGHIDQRGRGKQKYCMARIGDQGAYEPGNIYFTTNQNNGKEASEHAKKYYSENCMTSERDELGLTPREREAFEHYKNGVKSPKGMAEAMGVKYAVGYQYMKMAERVSLRENAQ